MTTETKKRPVAELREVLLSNGYSTDELKGKSKAEIRELVEQVEQSNDLLSNVKVNEIQEIIPSEKSVEEPKEAKEKNKEAVTVRPYDPEWTDYVLTLFTKDELENGNPRVDGLRRVAERLYGTFSIVTSVIEAPRIDNAGRASVVVRLEFLDSGLRGWVVDGAADVFSGNTEREYALHSLATAETRAEGRALRKALKLTKVLAAEETHNATPDEANGVIDNRVPKDMINSLLLMCDRIGVDLLKTAIKSGYEINSIEDLTQKQALELANTLNKYHRQEQPIPDEVRR